MKFKYKVSGRGFFDMTEQCRLSGPDQNTGKSSDSFATVYLNSLPGLYAMLSQEKKRDLELKVRG